MSKILMSIKPEYVDKIFSGEKKYEYRKRTCKEKIDTIIVYSSSPIQKVVGELKIKQVLYDKKDIIWNKTNKYGGITKTKYDKYFENCSYAVAYEIEKAILYNKQKDLKDFNVRTAPQSYVYITNKGVDRDE
ncbi:MAG: ASCH domain-containing protein [Bacilli bacterium]|nr:ASCH domain-containing protein [Bacilli bacterium]